MELTAQGSEYASGIGCVYKIIIILWQMVLVGLHFLLLTCAEQIALPIGALWHLVAMQHMRHNATHTPM